MPFQQNAGERRHPIDVAADHDFQEVLGRRVGQSPRPEVINLIPAKFRSGIPIDVTGDDLNKNFELKSR